MFVTVATFTLTVSAIDSDDYQKIRIFGTDITYGLELGWMKGVRKSPKVMCQLQVSPLLPSSPTNSHLSFVRSFVCIFAYLLIFFAPCSPRCSALGSTMPSALCPRMRPQRSLRAT